MKFQRSKKPVAPKNPVQRWEVEWEYESTLYGSYPLHRTFASALREASKVGALKDDYGFKLEKVTIKKVLV